MKLSLAAKPAAMQEAKRVDLGLAKQTLIRNPFPVRRAAFSDVMKDGELAMTSDLAA